MNTLPALSSHSHALNFADINPPAVAGWSRRQCLGAALSGAFCGALLPLGAVAQTPVANAQDESWFDAARKREVPVKIRWPDAAAHPGPRPVILFSHGLGGTREGGAVWGAAWAAAGFVVVHLQHAGSDLDAIRASGRPFTNAANLRALGDGKQLLARLYDVNFVLTEIERRHTARQDSWASIRPTQFGMSGHSFGAITSLGVAGQRYTGFEAGVNDPRLAGFMAFSGSPPPAAAEADARRALERMTRPMLCLTGTRDSDVAGTGATPERRRALFGLLPAGDKSQLVLADADHMTFAGQTGRAVEIIPRDPLARELQSGHHGVIARLTTDWWRATLHGDAAAKARLAVPSGLAAGDVWEQR
jgi:predicted dienelactone hydrolase